MLTALLGLLALAAIVVAALSVGGSSTAALVSSRTVTVQKGVVESIVSGSGNLEPAKQADVNFATSGRITHIYTKVGAHVSKDELLARIDDRSARVALAKAQADLVDAEDALTSAQEGTANTSTAATATATAVAVAAAAKAPATATVMAAAANAPATAHAAAAATSRPATAHAAAAATSRPATAHAAAAATSRPATAHAAAAATSRPATAHAAAAATSRPATARAAASIVFAAAQQPPSATPDALPTATASPSATATPGATAAPRATTTPGATAAPRATTTPRATATPKATAAPTQVPSGSGGASRGGGGSGGASQSGSGGSAQSGGGSTQSVESAQASVDSAQLALEEAQDAVDATLLRAPMAGTVASIDGEVGDQAGQSASGQGASDTTSSAFIVLAALSKLKLDVALSESDIGKVEVGQDATVTVNAASGEKVAGKVTSVGVLSSSSSDSSSSSGAVSYPVTVTLSQTTDGLKSGMSATADVAVARASGLVVPSQALRGSLVTVQDEDGGRSTQRVQTGVVGESTTQIVSGLEAGQKVVVTSTAVRSTGTTGGQAQTQGRFGGAGGGGFQQRRLGGGAGGGFGGGAPPGGGGPGG